MKLSISYYPFNSGVNRYSERMREVLGGFSDVTPLELKQEIIYFLKFKKKKGSIAIINWVENMIISSLSGRLKPLGVIKLFFLLFVLKVRYDRVIYVQHNVYPHDTFHTDINRVKWFIEKISLFVDVTVVHSPLFNNKKYIPHPLYDSPLEGVEYKEDRQIEALPYLVFGRIEKYKKIDEIIGIFPDNKKLIIAGSCSDEKYADMLSAMVSTKPNITLLSTYLSDEDVKALFSSCSAIIIGHSDPDMIVSGSFFFSLTEQLPILAINSPFLSWVESKLEGDVVKTFSELSLMMDFIKCTDSSFCFGQGFKPETIRNINILFGDETISDAMKEIVSGSN